MLANVKTALRTLLLSTSDVPGTEGRKAQLHFDGHGNNLLFGAPSFFATPNFADTYNPIVKLLHDGPSPDSHLILSGAAQLASGSETVASHGYLAFVEPKMPILRQMHELVAKDPRAQAKFFLLMSELHSRFLLVCSDSISAALRWLNRTVLCTIWSPPLCSPRSCLAPLMCKLRLRPRVVASPTATAKGTVSWARACTGFVVLSLQVSKWQCKR